MFFVSPSHNQPELFRSQSNQATGSQVPYQNIDVFFDSKNYPNNLAKKQKPNTRTGPVIRLAIPPIPFAQATIPILIPITNFIKKEEEKKFVPPEVSSEEYEEG